MIDPVERLYAPDEYQAIVERLALLLIAAGVRSTIEAARDVARWLIFEAAAVGWIIRV